MTRTVFVEDPVRFRKELVAGSFWLGQATENGEALLWYVCPCGCGVVGTLWIGNGFKPGAGPSWEWNGSLEAPTLNPSVNHVGHWHGWLRNGEWEPC